MAFYIRYKAVLRMFDTCVNIRALHYLLICDKKVE